MTTTISNIEDWKKLLAEAENGSNLLQLEVAMLFENGVEINGFEIVKKDAAQDFKWTKIAYENGNLDALVRYADYLSSGYNGEKNLELAIHLYEKGMEFGSSIAAFNLGIEYRNKQEFEHAFRYYQKAKTMNSESEDFTIAKCYYYGIGTEKDKCKAIDILNNITFPQNNQYEVDEANYMIGMLYLEGEVVEKSIKTARHYLELANQDEDHRSAQEILQIIGRADNIL